MSTLLAPFRPFELSTRPATIGVPVDAVRTATALELSFDLPGFDPESIDLSVDRNVLTLTAERSRSLPEDARLLVGERRLGKVRRQLRLSDSLDLGEVSARFDNGVLHVSVPVAETAQPHKVQIAVGASPLVETAAVEAGDDATSAN